MAVYIKSTEEKIRLMIALKCDKRQDVYMF
jgi:hypothetical protein